jgi:hypothetical protein
VERQTTMDDLLRRWKRLKEQHEAATIEDLSAEIAEDPAELRERLQAVASMMSFLGMGTESGSLGHRSIGETVDLRTGGRGVLETVGMSVGQVPRVLLRDTDGGPEPPLHRPSDGDETAGGTRYRIDGEIARGGMGAVLRGRDPDLRRDVALKVLRDDFRENAEMVRRFVEEAQIAGQLQHPGIVPVYELGTFGDRRPFFSMKLVKGDTLATLLVDRPNPADGLPRFLSIFESIG